MGLPWPNSSGDDSESRRGLGGEVGPCEVTPDIWADGRFDSSLGAWIVKKREATRWEGRERKYRKRRYGMRVSGRSIKAVLLRLIRKKAPKR